MYRVVLQESLWDRLMNWWMRVNRGRLYMSRWFHECRKASSFYTMGFGIGDINWKFVISSCGEEIHYRSSAVSINLIKYPRIWCFSSPGYTWKRSPLHETTPEWKSTKSEDVEKVISCTHLLKHTITDEPSVISTSGWAMIWFCKSKSTCNTILISNALIWKFALLFDPSPASFLGSWWLSGYLRHSVISETKFEHHPRLDRNSLSPDSAAPVGKGWGFGGICSHCHASAGLA